MKQATQTMAVLMVGLGVALIVRTLTEGGFGVGVLLGLLFVAAGVGRLLMLRRRTP
jgi:hypothetical protein